MNLLFYLADRTYKEILNIVNFYRRESLTLRGIFYLMGYDREWAGPWFLVLVQVHDQLDCFDLMVLIGQFPYLIQFGYLYLKIWMPIDRKEIISK